MTADALQHSALRRIDAVCGRFEAAWKAGAAPRIEDYLADCRANEWGPLLRELIPVEVQYRRRAGQQPRIEDYRTRFPTLEESWLAEMLAPARAGPSHRPLAPPALPGAMHETPVSLLQRLGQPAPAQAWDEFVQLFTPLLFSWAQGLSLQDADAADLMQDVFVILLRKLPHFTYDPQQSFRRWLWTVLLNQWRDQQRRRRRDVGDSNAPALDGPASADPAEVIAEAEYRNYLVGRALELMQTDFQATTWKACWEYVVRDRPAAEVATELGISTNAVYLAKARVLSRLRHELQGLLD